MTPPGGGAGPAAGSPKVTVAIPTWNRAGYLREALASVLAQTLGDIEVLVSDNGSTDETAEVVAAFGDERVRHLPLPENIGLVPNLDRCLHLGTAPYLTVFGDDDLMAPENLAAKVAMLDARPEAVVAHSSFTVIDGEGRVVTPAVTFGVASEPVEPGPTFIARTMAGGNRIGLSAAVVRRSALADEHFEEADGPACDVGLWLRLALRGDVVHRDEPLVSIRHHAASMSVALGGADHRDGRYSGDARLVEVREVKERFLDAFGEALPDAGALRARARHTCRSSRVRGIRLSGASGGSQIARLARLAREDAGVLRTSEAAQLLAGGLAGPRGARAVQRLRSLTRRLPGLPPRP